MATITNILESIIRGEGPKSVTLVTHKSQPLHADETAATAVLKLFFNQFDIECDIVRTFNPSADGYNDDTPNTIIYDIGLGCYDHHQPDGSNSHCLRDDADGITRKYSSIGLIWKEIGHFLTPYEDEVYNNFIRYIDDQDNGFGINPLSWVIKSYNDLENGFENAVSTFTVLFCSIFNSLHTKAELEKEVDSLVDNTIEKGNKYTISDKFLPGIVEKLSEKEIPFYIYPNPRGGYVFRAVTKKGGEQNDYLVPIPEEVREWEGVTFLHPNRFMGSATDKATAVKVVDKILSLAAN